MSTLPDNEFDLEKLFLPAWAQQPASAKSYSEYEGGEQRFERRDDRRGPRPPRRDRPAQGRRDDSRPRGENRPPGERRGPARPEGQRGFPRGGGDRERPRRDQPRERRPAPPPLPELNVSLIPDDKGVESLARQIKMTGRAYPLFDIAQMILQKPERHLVSFKVQNNAEGKPVQPLFVCALDDTLWLSEDEAIAHVLKKHFGTFYQAERTATEPPKGKYTFVAQCGMSGAILGPPNHHDYQNQLRKLHAERYARMPFEAYKARVRIVRDEEVVKKWVEDQSFKTEYICLNMPEPTRLATMEAVEKHFRDVHKENIIKPVETHTLTGAAARLLRSPDLVRLVRSVWEDQRRFPLQIATVLSQQFANHGLQFFKVNRTVTHVTVARPHYLDMEATPVSEGVKRIVDYINTHAKCTRRQLMEVLAPAPAVLPVTPPAEGQTAPTAPEPTAEQTAVVADLHWLIHQGHVIEFANGTLETAKKPLPKPPKPEKAPEQAPAEEGKVGATAAAASEGSAPASEATAVASAESATAPAPVMQAPENAAPTSTTETAAEPAPSAETPGAAPEQQLPEDVHAPAAPVPPI
jgi:hypothetical protein